MKVFLVLFLFISNHSVATEKWFYKNKADECKEFFSPYSMMSSSFNKCNILEKNGPKVVISCKSDTPALNGTFRTYSSLSACEKDGGSFNSKDYEKIKAKWKSWYNTKLWAFVLDPCGGSDTKCALSPKSPKELIETISPTMSKNNYRCGSTFDVIFESDTPSDNSKKSFMCVNSLNACALSVMWFETEKECLEQYKKSHEK